MGDNSSFIINHILFIQSGDDDINDVAAMGGVNLAEESQRILGSTEYVGTQIRSCRDETMIQPSPILAKFKVIGEFQKGGSQSDFLVVSFPHHRKNIAITYCLKAQGVNFSPRYLFE